MAKQKKKSASEKSAKTADKTNQQESVLTLSCPYCQSADFVKRGTRLKQGGRTQLYLCRACGRTFTPAWSKGRRHGWQVILDAMSYYNLGFSLEQVCKILKEKFKAEARPSTISGWLDKYGRLCAYRRMRPFAIKTYSPYEVMETCTLAHRQLYRFRYHKAKCKFILADDFKHFKFKPMKEFLDNVTAETPHQYFQEGERASESPLKFSKTEMIVRAKHNYACALAGLVFQGVSDNKQRHEALQKFFLANDSVTVATEVPVYLRREDLEHMQTQLGFKLYTKNKEAAKDDDANSLREIDSNEIPKLITGHIDFLQIRNGAIHILDYKGEAAKERPIEQLTLYALALSRLTGLRLFHFKCAWFDEKDYFEFFPLHVVYKRNRGRKRIKTIEGVYNLNEKVNKIENLRPMV
ncbi:MAG: PD-(D/E)XK nuclease family protein [bacterium]|nr:PD-(D/E)XK nuclease family protein [bacterium]